MARMGRVAISGCRRIGILSPESAHEEAPATRWRFPRAGAPGSITFLIGIARGRHHTQTRNSPWARFFDGVAATKKRAASCLLRNEPA